MTCRLTQQTLENIQCMIDTVIVSLENVVPEVAHAYYDFHAKTFCDSGGGQLLEAVLGSWSHNLARSGTASAGSLRLRDAYSSDPWYAKKAARNPSFWSKFYATRVNS